MEVVLFLLYDLFKVGQIYYLKLFLFVFAKTSVKQVQQGVQSAQL